MTDWPPGNPRWIPDDLDRCEHGRHAADPCFDCPDGQSTGNLFLSPEEIIGHTLGGMPIRAPYRRSPSGPGQPW